MNIPTREIYWNIPGHNLVYLFFLLALVVFGYGLAKRIGLWKLGRPENRAGSVTARIWGVFKNAIAQLSVIRERVPGSMHVAIYSGMVVLTIGTFLVLLQADFSLQILFGQFYLWYSLLLDLFGVLFILGLLYAVFRRTVLRPSRLNIIWDDAVILPLLILIAVTGFLLEGTRIAATKPVWAAWSPVGLVVSRWFSPEAAVKSHRVLWWVHMVISMAGIAYVPYSKLFHVLISPVNMYFKSFNPRGALSSIDIDNSETFGVTDIHEFTWKQLLDLDACTQCGRCQDQCPAFNSDKPLSPKKIILDLQKQMVKRGPALIKSRKSGETELVPIVGNAVLESEIWACTTCMACQEHCPVEIEHVQKIVDMRRSRVLMESQFPQELNLAFKGLETNANPWNMAASSRGDWMEGLDVPVADENSDVEYLWFVGCSGAFDDNAKATSRAMVKILNHAGISYAVLGADEQCCGDPARRSGNEYVFQMLAGANIEMFKTIRFKKMLTACPHCYNVIRNEYPQFDGCFEIVHHTELIMQLIREGRLSVSRNGNLKAAYHDSCYLGRYQGQYDNPRNIMRAVNGGQLKELKRHGADSFCCGGGGATFFMEETGKRINHLRLQEALDANVDTLGVACPFCMTMLVDAAKDKEQEENIQIRDIAQIVAGKIEAA